MPCFHPVSAWQRMNGEIVFAERGDIRRQLSLPCGQCIGCRSERAREWAMRCMQELKSHSESCFLTLTYDEQHLPSDGSLSVRDWQLFAKRMRKRVGEFRFYMCGEYGSRNWRPHFHVIVFGRDFPDKLHCGRGSQGDPIYSSAILDSIWGRGFASIGNVTFESCAYVASYCIDKFTGPNSDWYYCRLNCRGVPAKLVPPFNIMSRRPGIGANWLYRNSQDVFAHDSVVINGKECAVPRYYDKVFERTGERAKDRLSELKALREMKAQEYYADSTPERLAVRKEVFIASYKNLRNV